LTDIPVQDLKNCFEQCRRAGNIVKNYKEIVSQKCRLLISAALKSNFLKKNIFYLIFLELAFIKLQNAIYNILISVKRFIVLHIKYRVFDSRND
jgi:hypothetical protein